MTIDQMKKRLGLKTTREVADFFNVPVRTMEGWASKRSMPEYVEGMMEYICIMHEMAYKRPDSNLGLAEECAYKLSIDAWKKIKEQ